jgi:hypothetical protein
VRQLNEPGIVLRSTTPNLRLVWINIAGVPPILFFFCWFKKPFASIFFIFQLRFFKYFKVCLFFDICFSISDLIHKQLKNESKAETVNSLLENEAISIESLNVPLSLYLKYIEID